MSMNKKAIVMKYIVAIILLVITLGVIFSLFYFLNLGGSIDKEACRASVIARSAFNFGDIIQPGPDFFPLNCKTEKICISYSGKRCDAAGFKPSSNNKITKYNVGSATSLRPEILDKIAESMYDCHWMLGEGKLDFLPGRATSRNYCLICSRIALDDRARETVADISYVQLYQYLQQKKTPSGMSYLEFIYGAKSASEMAPVLENMLVQINEQVGKDTITSINDFKIDLDFKHGNAIIVQMSPKGTWDDWVDVFAKTGGSILVVGAVIASPFTGGLSLTTIGIGGALIVSGEIVDRAGGTLVGDENKILVGSGPIIFTTTPHGAKYGFPTLYSYNVDVLQSIGCTSFEVAS